ncbi:non-ribosomal peptide synthase/polyketide synthase [Pseudomonas sp. PSKL.D1]|uniref:non-ribosomal peptide synthase/polyketide synthase n=1 Tax=Pseudomonas sp. PSKL.D1 TaxID=3029060 RepID=UPI0023816AFD|nr:non-ribosomal peptide synthase/polyketide synthase [Pseudomonas sp. PSKL.D1]WDY56393.1 non-ribosomal peptide synthase/polyketide synthase [Pseudomonas sp. PSKL.D1]
MDRSAALRIAKRFIALPLDKRRQYLAKMAEQQVSPANLPIPEIRDELDQLPLSFAQERQWFLWQLEPGSSAYHIPTALRLRGQLDAAALQQAFDALVARHETLRTTFVLDGERPRQQVQAQLPLAIERLELPAGSAADEREAHIQALIEQQVAKTFDLERGPLVRVGLLAVAEDEHVLVMVQHHIVSDGWSMQVMVDELMQLYLGFVEQRPVHLPALAIQYADYAVWQRRWMEAGGSEQQLAYWREQLGDRQPVLELPTDRPRAAQPSLRGARFDLPLDRTLSQALQALAQQEQATLFMLLLASFQVLLHRYSGQTDIRVGVPTANRNRVETDRLLGFFVNTQVLRADVEGPLAFRAVLQQVKQAVLGAQAHQDLPFEQLVEALQPDRSLSHNPLFQVMYNHQRQDRQARDNRARQLPGLSIEGMFWESHNASFDLTLDTVEGEDGLWASLTYACDLFDATTIERLGGHWLTLLRGIVANPAQCIAELPLLAQAEWDHLLAERNAPDLRHVDGPLVHVRIAELAAQAPDATALLFGDQRMSFAELDQQANRLAHALIKAGVGPEVLVGIALERGLQMVVSLLAVLKTGGAYTPLDPEYPRERLAYLMQDSGMALLLSDHSLLQRLPVPQGLATLALDQLDLAAQPGHAPSVEVAADNLAYVIYTSGSTGLPKGVAVAHGPIAMHCRAIGARYEMSAADCELHFMSFAFDGAHERWLTALTHGASLLIRDPQLWTPEQTYNAMHTHGVTVAAFPPVYLQQLAEHAERDGNPPPVRVYCFGGDAVAEASYALARRVLRPTYIINGYGPTETVVTPLIWKAAEHDPCGAAYAPIGDRVGERRAYVFDADLNLLPLGIPGELYLGGQGLARGYLKRPALTAERFVPDPFGEGARLYRSGDLVSQRGSGIIDYLGRIDRQVKVRGFRIELGEVEARLLESEGIREAVVVACEGPSGQQLVGYVVPEGAEAILADATREGDLREALRARLKQQLPDYMVPAHLLVLASLPLTPNGKVDRKRLPQPDLSALQQAYQAPQTPLQQQIADIWQQVLKLERVGLADNFFELGGDSIVSIQVVSRARAQGIHFTPKDLFQHQTVLGLARVAQVGGPALQVDQSPVVGPTPLLPVQQLFFEDAVPQRHHWNQSLLLNASQPLHAQALEQALQAILRHHDALRLVFEHQAGHWQASYRGVEQAQAQPLLWQVEVADADALLAACERAQRSLDLADGPLLRAMLAQLPDGQQRLLLVIHHLVVDGVSWRILLEDLAAAYARQLAGEPAALPAKTSSLKTWAERLREWAQAEARQAQVQQWQASLQQAPLDLPRDRASEDLASRRAQHVHTRLDASATRQLLQACNSSYRTQVNDLLLAALARVMVRWTGEASLLIQMEGHGREALFDDIDLSRTVGWFTSVYPVLLTPAADMPGSIKQIKEQLRAIPDKGLGFGVLRHLGDDATRATLAALPNARLTFNYLGQFDSSFDTREGQLWAPAPEPAGAEHSEQAPLGNWLTINGQVYDGQLRLGWHFSDAQYDRATIEQLAARYADELQVLIAHCTSHPNAGVTSSDFPLAGLTQAQLDGLPVAAGQIEDIYPLSPMQQGMLFHTLYEQNAGGYINQMRMNVSGLDPQRFREAWQQVLAQHEILRSRFLWNLGERPLQLVHRSLPMPMRIEDLRGFDDLAGALQTLARQEHDAGFDLGSAPLMRLVLARTEDDGYHLIYTSHHILMDGWSSAQLMGEVLQHYRGQPPAGAPARFRDYIDWLERQDPQQCEAFWRGQLQALQAPTRLAEAVAGQVQAGSGHDDLHARLSIEQTQRLQASARQHKVTVNTLVQGAWQLLLQRYTGQACVAFGATVAGRPAALAGAGQMIGLFINTLPVLGTPHAGLALGEWLQGLQATNLAAREYEHTALNAIQRWAGQGGEALFDNILVFENYPISEALQEGAPQGLAFSEISSEVRTNYPLTLAVNLGQTLSLHYSYARAHYDSTIIGQLNQHLLNLLLQIVEQPAQARVAELELLMPAERELQLQTWNDIPAISYAAEARVHELFEQQVQRTPDATALVFAGQALSYQALNTRANRLAQHLIELGVGPDVRVGIALQRSVEMVVSLLAVLKAGGAYVPLDPEYPAERLAYMIDDSGIALLLSNRASRPGLPLAGRALQVLEVDALALEGYSAANPVSAVGADNLAYIIYTSGSTGRPKGVGNHHGALLGRLLWMQQAYGLEAGEGVLQKTSFSFDVSVWEFLWPLSAGGRLVLAEPGDQRDPERLVALIQAQQVSSLHFVPSMLQAFIETPGLAACSSLKRLFSGGEALSRELLERARQRLPGVALYNRYGPAEAAINATHGERTQAGAGSVPIGRALPNTRLYVLGESVELLPLGAVGELYIGGSCLARGYHGQAALTAERFVPDPFAAEAGARAYRTGDLVRYLADGQVDYVSRVDHQVKVRGFRIELGEIETCLLDDAQVREAVVLAQPGPAGAQLVAYLVVEGGADESALRERLKGQLKAQLPDYMVPAHLLLLDKLPLNPNGKLDRKALPQPDARQAQEAYVAPQGEMEQALAGIWQDVLRLPQVGASDNFFELGGDSIISIQVVSRARQAGIRFSPKDLFEQQTIQALARVARLEELTQQDQGPVTGSMPLLPIQQGFFDKGLSHPEHWNQSVSLKPGEPLQAAILEQALAALVNHHDALRLCFAGQGETLQATHLSVAEVAARQQHEALLWQADAVDGDAVQALAQRAHTSLDPARGQLLRAVLANLPAGEQRLLLVIHHLVVDGVSWRILFEDLQTAYRQLAAGQRVQLPAKTTSYQQWGERLSRHARDGALDAQFDYWLTQSAPVDPVLPCADPHAAQYNRDAHTVQVRLGREVTQQLLQQAPAAYRTQVNDLLLTALARTLADWTGNDSALIRLEGHGREELFDDVDLTRTVGWFTTVFPLRLTPQADLAASIKAIKEQLRAIPDKGLGYGVLRYLGSDAQRQALAALAQPKVTFNYLGQFDGSFSGDAAALFAPSGEPAGADQAADAPLGNWLTVNGQVYDGHLSLAWTFSREVFDSAAIEALAQAYLAQLQALISHCIAPGNAGVTPSDFPLARLDQEHLDKLAPEPRQIEDLYPLSPMQQGMLFHSLYEQGSAQYLGQMRLDVRGLDLARFRQAWQAVMDKHDILRTSFLWEGLEQPLQCVQRQVDMPFEVLARPAADDLAQALDTLAAAERSRGFELASAPLLRLLAVDTGAGQHHLIYTNHHILMDGWSSSQLMGEVMQHYTHASLPQASGRYRDYIGWLQRQDAGAAEAFWRQQLAGLDAPTRLAGTGGLDSLGAAGQGHGIHSVRVAGERAERLNAAARQHKVTLNTLMQAAWLLLLQRYTRQDTVVFGATVAGRPIELVGIEKQIGLFINTLPVVARPRPEHSVGDWLQAVQAKNLGLRDYEHTPLFDIQRWAGQGGEALFDNILVFENYPIAEVLQEEAPADLVFGSVANNVRTNYPLSLAVGMGSSLDLHYSHDLAQFSPAAIERLNEHLLQLLDWLAVAPQQTCLGAFEFAVGDAREAMLHSWQGELLHYGADAAVHALFEQQVQRTPDATALVFAGQALSYQALNTRANRLAQHLIELGVGPDVRVGIALQRSVEMVVSLLAVLKAGGAYVPLDPEYPAERQAYMIDDSGIALLLSNRASRPGLPLAGRALQVLEVDALALEGYSAANPVSAVGADNLAYIIYTSGSTGRPKGVGNHHGALLGRLLWMQQAYGLEAGEGVLQKTSFSFDVSVWEFLWPLSAGGRLVLAEPGDQRDPERLVALIQAQQVSSLHFVPSMLQAFIETPGLAACSSLKRLFSGGEALSRELLERARQRLPGVALYNRYGPAEAAINATHGERTQAGAGSVPIGRALPNTRLYVLGESVELLPLGAVGELYIGGSCLARGYHGQAALTAERFVPDPFAAEAGARAYRTGDLVRYLADGQVDYVSRVDHQVKVRGFRIELGEIETCLLDDAQVREAVVLAQPGPAGAQLVAYLVVEGGADESALRERLKGQLKAQLPDYMVPAHLLLLDKLPLNPNGKLDRKALPQPDARQAQEAYVAPQGEMEQALAGIWQDVLRLPQVGASDNFFELGGDSIISIQVVSRARQAGIRFSPKDLFEQQTIQALARVARLEELTQQDQGPVTGSMPLLPIQQGFFGTAMTTRHHWNQSVVLQMRMAVDAEHLERALHALLSHHDALRLRFIEQAAGWQAEHAAPHVQAALLWQAELADENAWLPLAEQAQASLDLANGPLLRAVLATLPNGEQRLLLVIHHLVVDGVSWRILFEDLQTAYQQLAAGQPVQLPAKTSSYQQWGQRLQAHAQMPALASQFDYWLAQLQGTPINLPSHNPQGSQHSRHVQTVRTRLDQGVTQRLLQQAPAAYRTQVNDLLLTALARTLADWTGNDSALIRLEGHGREELFDDVDLTRTVGWFTTVFPLRLTPQADLAASIKAIKEQLRAIPDKGLGYGVLRHLGSDAQREALAALAQPKVTFNYLGQFDGSFAADDEAALFVPCSAHGGAEQGADAELNNDLLVNGRVFNGELSLNWTFSRERYAPEVIQQLADRYSTQLAALIEHCLLADSAGVTPSDFPLTGLDQAQLDALPVAPQDIEDIYPMSPMQMGMYFHSLAEPDAQLYINQTSVPVEGLDVQRMQAAWDTVIARHEVLRSSFHGNAGSAEPLQVVHRAARMPFTVLDWRDREVDAQALAGLARQCAANFDLQAAPLMRLTLVRLDAQRHQLIWTRHHLLMDGWSNSQLLAEVFVAYAGQALPAKQGRYRDYIAWLQAQPQTALEGFWKGKLAGLEAPTLLADSLYPKADASLAGHAALYLDWDAARTARLREQAQRLRVTPNTLVQAVWLILLQRYSGRQQVCFGATVAGRPATLPGSEQMLGLFINTLPIIQAPAPGQRFDQWLLELQAYNLEVRDHEHAALADVQRWSGQGGQALFDSIIVFENYPVDERLQGLGQGELRFGQAEGRDVTNYAMDLAVNLGERLNIEFLYLRNRFTEQGTAQIRDSFEHLLQSVLDAPAQMIGNLGILGQAQCRLLSEANRLPAMHTGAASLLERLQANAVQRPQALAVVCDDVSLTFAELELRANRLANRLAAEGVGPEVLVGIALERSVDVIVAFYAVLKAGGGYVPLDIDYPAERLQWIAENSAMALLLTQATVTERLPALTQVRRLVLEQLDLQGAGDHAPQPQVHDDSLAYVIYTSGSTGRPKGVAVARGPLQMHCEAIIERYAMTPQTRELLFMSFAFDGAQERWLSTLLAGGGLVLRGNRLWTAQETWDALHTHGISIACFPPAYLQQLAEYGQGRDNPPPVQVYCFGGDAVAEASFELVRRNLRPRWITNGYGPTETVVTPLLWKAGDADVCGAAVAPIGQRVGSRTLYVLDDQLNPLPHGVVGELYIGGIGLARGYRAQPGLSAERFIADPFGGEGGRLYRTGDLVRLREDGVMDYMGRVDHQVKVRGFRIELGEIEACLRREPGVRDALVVARDVQGSRQLVGYVTTEGGVDGDSLRAALQGQLPDYMVPAQIVLLEAFPLSPNGKVDRKALPDPQLQRAAYLAPRNALERALAQIWQEVLELERVGMTDNFFELGGDSLRTLKVLSKVRAQPELGLTLSLRDMMSKPTIAELSGYQPEAERALDPLLPLNGKVAGRAPLFCLHAGFGTVFDYEPLARSLEGIRSVYGLQCRMQIDRQWRDESLAAMAIDYAQYIRQKQAHGPYYLLGWSLGGPLAVLVAHELERQGQQVAWLGLADSYVPRAQGTSPAADWGHELRQFLSIALNRAPEQLPAFALPAGEDAVRIQGLIEGLLRERDDWRAHLNFSVDDLAHTFVVAMRLKALGEQQQALPALQAPTLCWWNADAERPSRAAFEQALGNVQASHRVAATHFQMLQHPMLIEQACDCLEQAQALHG